MFLPAVEVVFGNSAGSMNGDGSRKILLHSTEGSTIEGAIGAYRANNSWPHLTVDCKRRRVVEHLDLLVAARSLRNEAGGVETNRDGSVHVQIEMVGFASDPPTIGSLEELAWFGRQVIRPIADLTAVPLRSTVQWTHYPASYGRNAAQRLSVAAWDAYSGILGHQHAPENSHGDPGALNVAHILAAAGGAPIEEDWFTMATKADLRAVVDEALRQRQSPPGYFAVPSSNSATTYYVAADHQSKLQLVRGGEPHKWIKNLHAVAGLKADPVIVDQATLDAIPDAE